MNFPEVVARICWWCRQNQSAWIGDGAQNMKNFPFVLLSLVAVLSFTPTASADQFTYAFNGSGFNAALTFTASPVSGDPGVYLISNVAGTIFSAGTDILAPVSFNVPVVDNPNSPSTTTAYFPSVAFIYDNLLTPASSRVLNFNGVLFDVSGLYFNLYSNNGIYQWADTGSYTNSDNISDPLADPPIDGAPEPSPLLLLVSGLLALAGIRLRRARNSRTVLNL